MKRDDVVLITGCSSGFGHGLALKFARNGHRTYAGVRSLKSSGVGVMERTITQEQLPLSVVELDVTDEKNIARIVDKIVAKEGHIDILINNAGYGYLGTIEETPISDIKALYEVNVHGVLRMIKNVVPVMRKQRSGVIINLSSINGIVPFPLFSIYSTSKFAIETLTEGLRFELGHFGIKVAMVEPGSYLTSFSSNRKESPGLHDSKSPYRELVDFFFTRYKKTHRQGDASITSKTANPTEVVDKIYSLAHMSNPPLRTIIGGDAMKFYVLRKLLPGGIWEWLVRRVYRW
jgi:NAD(P)-dependent dehydrogenase (short-subunit alcohol dehydrogenase family)